MVGNNRKSGIDIIGNVPWGMHFCQFYESKEDLIEILVPYFKAGLEGNEFCMWVTSEPLDTKEAEASLRKAVKNLDEYIEKGQIEIMNYSEWYTKSGRFDADQVLQGWVEKEKSALEKGFDGLRLTGNTFWLERKDWDAFAEYENTFDSVIDSYRMLAICTYPLEKCSVLDILDVATNHRFALIRKESRWQVIRTAEQGRLQVALDSEVQNYRHHMDNSSLGVRIVTAEGQLLYANQAILDIYGYSSFEELENTLLKQRYTPESHAEHQERKEKRKRDEFVPSDYEISIVRKDGEVRYLSVSRGEVVWNGERQFQSLYQDITERKQAEQEVTKFKTIADNAGYGVGIATIAGEFTYLNKSYAKMHGYTPEEVIGQHYALLYTEEQLAVIERYKKKLLDTGGYYTREIWHERKDGTIFPTLMTVLLVKDKYGEPLYTSAIVVDITERKRAEEALRESEERYRALIELGSRIGEAVVMLQDTEDKMAVHVFVNDEWTRITGYSREELLTISMLDLIHPRYREAAAERHQRRMKGEVIPDLLEISITRKDGTEVPVEVTYASTTYKGKIAYVGYIREITERKKLEEERQRASRLESLSTLAGGIAHDFNNLLTGILGNVSLAKRYVEPDSKAAARLTEAEKASVRAKDLTQQLLTFARGGAPIKKNVSIGQLLVDATRFALRGSNIGPEFSLSDDLWPVDIDEGQINQVLTNLIINSGDAMPQGGTIQVSARNLSSREARSLKLTPGKYIGIDISDHGVGILPEHLNRIFEPYFTTKQKGSGLGLATVYSIVRNHDGHITVESEVGIGTTFHIYLPTSKKPIAATEEMPADAPITGRGKILVMDDEDIIREFLYHELTEIGYDVKVTSNGTEAVEQYRKAKTRGKPFEAVILDLTVSGAMGGKEAIKRLRKIDPKVKAIVSSGYSTDPIMSIFKKYGFSAVVTKPYSVAQLEKTLHSLLREKK